MATRLSQFEGTAPEAVVRLTQAANENLATLVTGETMTVSEQLIAVAAQIEIASAMARLAIAEALDRQADAFIKAYQLAPEADERLG